MKTFDELEQRSPEWHEIRRGVITGSKLKDVIGTPYMRKQTFYKVLAERLSVGEYSEESAMARGVRLEDDARIAYEKESGYTVKICGFTKRDDNLFIGESPDGLIEVDGKWKGALEIKCLGSHNHVKAKLENKIPDEYEPQVIQKFIVNDDLEWVDFFMFDPRIVDFPELKFRINREDVLDLITEYKNKEVAFLNEIETTLKALIKL